MSPEFRKDVIRKLQMGEIWGIVCTDAAGMVQEFIQCRCLKTYYD